MKKLLSILFLFIFLFNLAGYYVVFTIMQQSAKRDMKAFIKKNPETDELEKVVISSKEMSSSAIFKFTDDNEFIYNGELFDVVSKTTDGDNTVFYCLDDRNEEKLFAGLNEHIKNNCDQNSASKNLSLQLIKNIIKEALPDNYSEMKPSQYITFLYSDFNPILHKQFIQVIAPPPKA